MPHENAFRRETHVSRDGDSMRFHRTFEKAVAAMNEKRLTDPEIQEALKRYSGRSLVFKVQKDATYVFHFSGNGVEYEVNPPKEPDSMYIEMDLERASKLVYQHTLSIFDIPHIIHRKIKLADVNFARKLFGAR